MRRPRRQRQLKRAYKTLTPADRRRVDRHWLRNHCRWVRSRLRAALNTLYDERCRVLDESGPPPQQYPNWVTCWMIQ